MQTSIHIVLATVGALPQSNCMFGGLQTPHSAVGVREMTPI